MSARVEAAFGRQLRALGIERPIVWRDGLAAARALLIGRALASLPEVLPAIAARAAGAGCPTSTAITKAEFGAMQSFAKLSGAKTAAVTYGEAVWGK
ncbi:MAG: hypothetical protein M0002_19045 [Rhodospirillales bacterium]|nr:hypothetical protein [Rhodospirillales bacterium]